MTRKNLQSPQQAPDPTAGENERPVQDLVPALGYAFGDRSLLERAMVHRSYGNEAGGPLMHNERLEFLGDAVVNLVVAQDLMERLPHAREGELSKRRALVVSEGGLARAATQLQLGRSVRLGRGEIQTGGRGKASILADTFEALVGAVYLDGGFAQADRFVRRHLGPTLEAALAGELQADHKTLLQEWAQARYREAPHYHVVGERGPDHAKSFEVAVCVADRELARASGSSKKEAQQRAAEQALANIASAHD